MYCNCPVLQWLSCTCFSFYYPIGSVHFLSSHVSEWFLGKAIFLRTLQSYESHVVHWLWCPSARQHVWPLDYHAKYDCWSHLLCNVCWPCHSFDSVFGFFKEAVSRKGMWFSLSYLQPASSEKKIELCSSYKIISLPQTCEELKYLKET